MARKRQTKRFSTKAYNQVNGNWLTNLAMCNDEKLYNYVRKNKSALLKLKKADKLRLIKANVGTNWARDDLKRVNNTNVKASVLNKHIRNV